MTEERITEVETPTGNTHTTTTVVRDGEQRSGGASWGLIIVLLILGAIAIFVFMRMSDSEVAQNNAVADAAGEVGEAAGQVGDAAQDAADNLGE